MHPSSSFPTPPPPPPSMTAPPFFTGRHQQWFDAAAPALLVPAPPSSSPTPPPPPSAPPGYQGWVDADGVPLDEVLEEDPTTPLPTPPLVPASTAPPPLPPSTLPAPLPSSTLSPPLPLPSLPPPLSPPTVPSPPAPALPCPSAIAASSQPPDATRARPLALLRLPPLLVGLSHLESSPQSVASVFDSVIPALEAAFPADRRPPPLRVCPADPHPADILNAGFPTVPAAGIPQSLALTAFEEALAVVLPARQEPSPPWMESMANVGVRYPLSPAMPWAVAYACRLDDGGPASRARGQQCPYWTSPACRVTVYYSAERLAHLAGEVLRGLPDAHHVLRQRDTALRARIAHGCFSAHGLATMFGRALLGPGLEGDDLRPLWLIHILVCTLRHFGETVAMRAAPCDQHRSLMANSAVAVTHQLYQ